MKKILKYIPFQLSFFLIIGIVFDKYFTLQKLDLLLVNGLVFVWFVLTYFVDKFRFYFSLHFTITTWVFAFVLGLNATFISNDLNVESHYSNQKSFSNDHDFRVVLELKQALKPSKNYHKFEAELIQLDHTNTTGRVLLHLPKSLKNRMYFVGDQLVMNNMIHKLKAPSNPFGFNYKAYLENRQVYHQVFVSENHRIVKMPTNTTIYSLTAKFRYRVQEALKANGFSDDELDLINALLLGQRQDMNPSLLEHYKKAGAIHILAVSGLHIGVIYLIFLLMLQPLLYFKKGKLIRLICLFFILWTYALIVGMSVSVVRAVTMFTALGIGIFLNRKSSIYHSLLISIFVLLLFHPAYLFMVGFQMSYLAVFFIVWIQPKLSKVWTPTWKPLNKLWNLFTLSIAAQLGVLPLSIYYFHQFPGLFFLSNLVVIPFLGIILFVGIGVIFISMLASLPVFVFEIYRLVLKAMNLFIAWVADREQFFVEDIGISLSVMLGIYLIIISYFKWMERKTYHRFLWFSSMIICLQFILLSEKKQITESKEFIVFHNNATSLMARRSGSKLEIFEDNGKDAVHDYTINPYLLHLGPNVQMTRDTIPGLFRFGDDLFLTIDQEGIYNYEDIMPTVILLRNTPKINMDRMLNHLRPTMVIADGSNFRNSVSLWEQTCLQRNVPFFDTSKKGTLVLKE